MKFNKNINAYWLKSGVLYPVESTHISFVFDNPELFSIRKDELKSIYDKHNESLRFEGKARIVIIKKVTKQGWIRIRHYKRPNDYWSIQTDVYTKRKPQIDQFIIEATKNDAMNKNDSIMITGYFDNTQLQFDFSSGGVKRYISDFIEKG